MALGFMAVSLVVMVLPGASAKAKCNWLVGSCAGAEPPLSKVRSGAKPASRDDRKVFLRQVLLADLEGIGLGGGGFTVSTIYAAFN